jgi:predicted DNA-binding transcriptional regulator AlpA
MGNRPSEYADSERCQYASKRQVAEHFGVSPGTLQVWVNHYDFPAPVKLAPQTIRWRWSEVLDWEANRERVSNAGAASTDQRVGA